MRIDCGGIGGAPGDSRQTGLACDGLTKDGYVILDRVVAPDTLAALTAAFDGQHSTLDERSRTGERRFALTVDLAGPFSDPVLYANRVVMAVVRDLLGADVVLEWFGAEVTLSGAGPQHIHRDGRPLFDSTMSALLPAHALALVLPLDPHSVALWPKSHRWKARDEDATPEVSELPVGSCLLRDFRLFHGGTANRSDQRRVALLLTYARPWYRDPGDVLRGARMPPSPSDEFLAGLASIDRPLFALAS